MAISLFLSSFNSNSKSSIDICLLSTKNEITLEYDPSKYLSVSPLMLCSK